MADVAELTPTRCRFDDRNMRWNKLGDFEGFVVSILFVDEAKHCVDFAVKFEPNTRAMLHRHLAHTHSFVIEGEHIIYEMDGSVREIRPVGHYAAGPGGDCHNEGGGPDGAVLFYSVRGTGDALFDMIDDDENIIAKVHVGDFKAMLEAQQRA